ncbi:MAG: hypothetical protein ACFFG0_42775 [Candidatus Thorarchaeota archaeon]
MKGTCLVLGRGLASKIITINDKVI